MRLKVNALYAAGIVLLIGAAGVGDSFNTVPATQWSGNLAVAIIMALGGLFCWKIGRTMEIELESRRRRRKISRPEYRKNRRKDA